MLTVPGLLAACGGGGGIKRRGSHVRRRRRSSRTLAKTLHFSNWPLYIDVNEKTKKHPTLDAVHEEVRRQGQVHRGHQRQPRRSSGRSRGRSRTGQSIGRDIIVMTDSSGFPARMIKLGWLEKLDKPSIPNIKNLLAVAAAPGLGPEPRVLPAVAVGHDRHRLRPEQGRRRRSRRSTSCSTNPKLKGKVTLLTRARRRGRARDARERRRPDEGHRRRRSTRRSTKMQKAVDSGQVRQFTGNDYAPLLAKGDVWACIGVVGRHGPAPGRPPAASSGTCRTRGGMIWTDNMLIPKGGNVYTASVYMNYYYDAEGRGRGRGLRQLHLPGEGRGRGAAEDRPGRREEPADLPDAGDARERHAVRPEGASTTPKYKTKFAAADRGLSMGGSCTVGGGRRRTCCWRPGMAWLAVFFVVPMYYLANTSLQTGSLDVGYTFNWAWHNYKDALTSTSTQFIRSIEYAGIATLIALADQLPARVLDRVPRRPLEEPVPAAGRRAVLRHVPDPDARLGDDPRPTTASS